MSGKILIVDDLATNRIVLKVRLAAAYHHVLQAATGAEALELARRARPDMVLANATLADMTLDKLIAGLRALDGMAHLPVALIVPHDCPDARIAALRMGADDVVAQPLGGGSTMARLRNLLRRRHDALDLELREGTAQALGLAEARRDFQQPGQVVLISHGMAPALSIRAALHRESRHRLTACDARDALQTDGMRPPPDLYLLHITGADAEAGLTLLADLKSSRAGRHVPVIAMLEDDARSLAATVLDMGADDLVHAPAQMEELLLRMDLQLRRKRGADRRRDCLKTGLEAAMIDPLTGLHNRRFALPRLARVAEGAARSGRGFAVMVADLDHFKQVNDLHGHATGDAVLRDLAARLRDTVGPDDLLARIGGEEFLIVAPDCDEWRARELAARLRQTVRGTPVMLADGRPVAVTVSIGVAMAGAGTPILASAPEGLLAAADRALYSAKADGRDAVRFCARSAA